MNQKAQFFEKVVDVLKNDYGVSVVKKRSGKSFGPGCPILFCVVPVTA